MAWLEKRDDVWRVCYREGRKVKRIKAYTDKLASKALMADLERALARGERGLVDVYKEHRSRPVADHLAAWKSELCGSYAEQCDCRISRLIRECSWKLLADIDADSFIRWRQTALSDAAHNRKDRSKVKPVLMGPRTQNHYLATLQTFVRWCVRRKRIAINALTDVPRVDETSDVRRQRRALSEQEAAALVGAVPAEYTLLYQMILATGLRRAEAAALVWDDVKLNAPQPFVQLRAATTKAGRADVLPLRSDLAGELRKAKGEGDAEADDNARVFRRVPRIKEHRRWLDAAGIPYTDGAGRRADIHALRHTYGTLLSKSGVMPREAMSLMRHTDMRLTMKVYTDPRVFDLAGAVEKLPGMILDSPHRQSAKATGTDGKAGGPDHPKTPGAQRVARTYFDGQSSAFNGTKESGALHSENARITGERRSLAGIGTDCEIERAKGVEPSTLGLESPHSAN
jgi:integrase